MKNKEQRRYVREALRLVERTKADENFTDCRLNHIISILKKADKTLKNDAAQNNNQINPIP